MRLLSVGSPIGTEHSGIIDISDKPAAVDKDDEYFQDPIIVPQLDLSFVLHVDNKYIENSISDSDISVLSYSDRSATAIEVTNKPEVEKLELYVSTQYQ
jgi:hypothetical protein